MTPHSEHRDANGDAPQTVDAMQLARLEAEAVQQRHRVVRLDLAGCHGKQELLSRASAAFQFPDWFGHNWDALSDSLGDLSWLDAPGYLVVISSSEELAAIAPESWRMLCEVLADVERERLEQGVAWRSVRLAHG